VTASQLYAVYVGAYADAAHLFANGWSAADIELRYRAGLSAIEQAMADFAVLDATNGTPLRSCASFERLVEGGSPMLRRLELREREATARAAPAPAGSAR
jgi:hypothetical protein